MTEELAAELAVRLRDAHRQIASSGLSSDEKALATRRLLALSDTAKTNLVSASRRLDRLLEDLAMSGSTPASEAGEGPQT